MKTNDAMANLACQGILIRETPAHPLPQDPHAILDLFNLQDIAGLLDSELTTGADGRSIRLWLQPRAVNRWAPGHDTLSLTRTLQLDTENRSADLVREVLIAMLMGPVAFEFPDTAELASAVSIRCNIVQAARKTTLAFHTSEAERPEDCWVWDDEVGFVIRPGASLIDALTKATQPEVSGALYAFSCYRASEYVLLLGIAQELSQCNPALYQQLEALWTRRPVKSAEFHEVFLREQGSMDAPLPPRYFVPGDRTWFRNPDEASADASGFEGSWVMYLGGGLFTNFWQRDKPYTLTAKCLEIYHWRDALYLDAEGEQRIDEDKVTALVQATCQQPMEVVRILALMQRYREPRGVYTAAGGCIDTTREFARWVHPDTTDLVLPSD